MFKIGAVGRRVELPFMWIGIGFCPLIQALLCVGGGPQWPVALSHCLFVSWLMAVSPIILGSPWKWTVWIIPWCHSLFSLFFYLFHFLGCNSPSTSLSPNCGGPCSPAAMIGLNFQHLGFKFKHLLTTFLIKFLHWPPENNKYYCHV